MDSSGLESNHDSSDPSISSDGRYIVFYSEGSNLVANDTNGTSDVFIRDLQLATTVRLSVDASGLNANSFSGGPSISSDGRYVAFYSNASNLVVGDTNGAIDIFVRDLQLGTTVKILDDSSSTNFSTFAMSPDGRYIVFDSGLSNLVADDTNGQWDIFVRDLQLGTTIRVSVDSEKNQLNGSSETPSISDDGAYVTFRTVATNVISGISSPGEIYRRKLSDLR